MHPNSLAIPLIAPETVKAGLETQSRSRDRSADRIATESPVWTFGSHCPELDGVRGFAILLVTLYRFMKEWDPSAHWILGISKTSCELGERGVDLFFVLSGFLITGILLQTKSSPGYFKNFFIRRTLRIFPLYFTTLIVCLFVLPQFLATRAFDLPRQNQLFLWTYTSNVYMSWSNSWCFGPLDHFWSLAVEEHFYLVWPAIVFSLSSKWLLRLTIGLAVTVAVARAVFAMRPEYSVAIDALSLFRCDSLALGAMLAIAMQAGLSAERVNRLSKWLLPILITAGLVVVLSGKRLLGIPHTVFGCLWFALLALVVTRSRSHWMSRCLRASWLQWLGKYSYGMYVIQLPLVTLLPLSFVASQATWLEAWPAVLSVTYVVALFAMTSVLAFAIYHLLEKPFLSMKRFFH